MKIKLALFSNDVTYVERIYEILPRRFNRKINIVAFTNEGLLIDYMRKDNLDVLLCDIDYKEMIEQLELDLVVAYLVEEESVINVDGCSTVGKYQSLESLYRQILQLHVAGLRDINTSNNRGNCCRLVSVIGAETNSGSTTIALALAYQQRNKGKKVLYFTLEDFGSLKPYFAKKEIQFSVSDAFVSFMRNKSQALRKIGENIQFENGIHYFSECYSPLDFSEIGIDSLQSFLTLLQTSGQYDLIIVNQDPTLTKLQSYIGMEEQLFLLVANGTETCEAKLKKIIDTILILNGNHEVKKPFSNVGVIYNLCDTEVIKFKEPFKKIPIIGAIPSYGAGSRQQLIDHIASTSSFLDKFQTNNEVIYFANK